MLWWLAHTTVSAAILAGFVALVCRVGRLRPAVRHALWLLVLLKFMMPPLVAWQVPLPDWGRYVRAAHWLRAPRSTAIPPRHRRRAEPARRRPFPYRRRRRKLSPPSRYRRPTGLPRVLPLPRRDLGRAGPATAAPPGGCGTLPGSGPGRRTCGWPARRPLPW